MDITDLVKEDLEKRAQLGAEKYGARLSSETPCPNTSALQNLYEEMLDAVCYLKKLLMEARD